MRSMRTKSNVYFLSGPVNFLFFPSTFSVPATAIKRVKELPSVI